VYLRSSLPSGRCSPDAMRDYRTAGLINRNLRLKETDVLQVRAQGGVARDL